MSVEQRLRAISNRRLPADVEDVVPGGTVHACCRLTDELLLLVCSFSVSRKDPKETWLLADGAWRNIRSEFLTFRAPDADRRLVLVHVDDPGVAGAAIGTLCMRMDRRDLVLEPMDLGSKLVSVESLVRSEFVPTDRYTRAAISDFLLATTAVATRSPLTLSRALLHIREALRERPPVPAPGSDEDRAVAVDAIWEIDEHAFYIAGWQRQEGQTAVRLTAISPEGERIPLEKRLFRHPRADVFEFYGLAEERRLDRVGFVAYFETRAPSRLGDDWIVQIHEGERCVAEALAARVLRDLGSIRARVLGDLALESLRDEQLKAHHTLPALNRLQRRLAAGVEIESIDEFGSPAHAAEVSVVVPLYRRIDFLEYQLSEFVNDPELCAADLVYVLDSPEQADQLLSHATHLHRLYGVPFRVVTLTRNGGFAIANNLGASVARGRLLLLLNSDVLPERPGWLGDLVRFHDATPRIGVVGPKLVYEDDSLQHAGLYFDRPAGSHVWTNEHYFKGLHRDLPAANVTRRVPAVTGACMLMSLPLFTDLGGLRGSYVQGDYEDSDLCLRLAEQGLEAWYLPDVALYHLEGQSYPSEERRLTSEYNRWLHTYLWREALGELDSKEATVS
jgi:GT2 family glycosyltransferase